MSYRFYTYCFKLSKKMGAKFIIFLVFSVVSIFSGLFSFFTNYDFNFISNIISIISLIISIISFVNVFTDLRHMTGMELVKKCVVSNDLRDAKAMNCVNSEYKFKKARFKKGDIFYSLEINNFLIRESGKIKAEIVTGKYKSVREDMSNNCEQYLPFLAKKIIDCNSKGQKFTNDAKLCLSSDVNKNCVAFHFGTYYDTYLTNIICGCRMLKNDDCLALRSAIKFPKDDNGNLKSISSSRMNDEIGVSTIAFTSDNYMFFYKQNYRANSSEGLIAPSGSGSADARDYCKGSFEKSIIKGMERELLEETGLNKLRKKVYMNTNIIGYFRWVEKGGKPEFIGITRLNNVSRCEIGCQRSEVCEISDFYVATIDDLKKIAQCLVKSSNTSVPLATAMWFILELIYYRNFNLFGLM